MERPCWLEAMAVVQEWGGMQSTACTVPGSKGKKMLPPDNRVSWLQETRVKILSKRSFRYCRSPGWPEWGIPQGHPSCYLNSSLSLSHSSNRLANPVGFTFKMSPESNLPPLMTTTTFCHLLVALCFTVCPLLDLLYLHATAFTVLWKSSSDHIISLFNILQWSFILLKLTNTLHLSMEYRCLSDSIASFFLNNSPSPDIKILHYSRSPEGWAGFSSR